MTIEQLWVALCTAINGCDEQAAREVLAAVPRVVLEALLVELITDNVEEMRTGAETLYDFADGQAAIAAALPLYAIEVAQ